jgi:type IV pilus assembly protein PilW
MQRNNHIRGMTLIELMVALAIGAFLMVGALTVFMQSRTTFRVTESISRLQENGRFALEALEPDIRMAHYFGLTSFSAKIGNSASATEPPGIGPATCGNNWTIDFDNAVTGSNNSYDWACLAFGAAQANSDTLAIRRVTEDPIVGAPAANVMHLQSARYQDSSIFLAGVIPAEYLPATSQTHRIIAHGYYVSRNSSLDRPGIPVPSLRRKTLVAGPNIQDDEILPGVEDMQIQFGVDTDLVGDPDRGSIDRYVNPEDPIIDPMDPAFIPSSEILAVRIWLLLRAERQENGFTDTTNYVYADRNIPAPNDGFRRTLVSKTIYLRNARPPE